MDYVNFKLQNDKDFINIFKKYLKELHDAKDDTRLKKIFVYLLEENNFKLAELCIPFLASINFGKTADLDKDPIPLIRMSSLGNLDAVKFLIEHGADLDYLSELKLTAIEYSIIHCKFDVFKYLYDHGAKIDMDWKIMFDYYDKTITSFNGYKEVIKFQQNIINYMYEKNSSLQEKINYNSW